MTDRPIMLPCPPAAGVTGAASTRYRGALAWDAGEPGQATRARAIVAHPPGLPAKLKLMIDALPGK